MEDKFLSVEKFRLLEKMGLELVKQPAYCWVSNEKGDLVKIMENTADLRYLCDVVVFPALTLDDLLKMLPCNVFRYDLYINFHKQEIVYADENDVLLSRHYGDNGQTLMDAAFDVLCLLLKK